MNNKMLELATQITIRAMGGDQSALNYISANGQQAVGEFLKHISGILDKLDREGPQEIRGPQLR